MKKKIILFLLIVLGILCLVGCDSSNDDIEGILKTLQKKKIVSNDLKLIDTVTDISTIFLFSKRTYYIYENQNSELIAINYDTNVNSEKDYDYSVTIYYDITVNDNIEYIDNSSSSDHYFTYQNKKETESNKYNFENEKNFFISKENPLFGSIKYTIKKETSYEEKK